MGQNVFAAVPIDPAVEFVPGSSSRECEFGAAYDKKALFHF